MNRFSSKLSVWWLDDRSICTPGLKPVGKEARIGLKDLTGLSRHNNSLLTGFGKSEPMMSAEPIVVFN